MRGGNATHGSCKRACYAQRSGVEGNCPGKVGRKSRGGGQSRMAYNSIGAGTPQRSFFFFFFLELFLFSTAISYRQICIRALWAPYIEFRHDGLGSRLSQGVPSLLLLRPSVVSGSAQISRGLGGGTTLPTKSYLVLAVRRHEGKAVCAREGRVGGW